MNNAAAIATAVRDGWVVWEAPGKPVSVRLSIDVVSRMSIAVREGFKALPRRGLETGGLLIGSRRESGGQLIVEVEDFEAVESEHAAGPSYLLSEADRQLLESRIAAHGTSGKKPHVVGFYRSHTRNGFGITLEDEYVFSNYFRKSSDVFLLIKSNFNAPPTAGFLIRESGKVLSETPYVQFTFSPESAWRSARETPPVPPPPAPVPPSQTAIAPAPALPLQTAIAAAPQRPGFYISSRVVYAAAALAVLVAGLWFALWNRPTAAAQGGITAPLALSISNSGSGLKLSWNHRAAQRATQAILWIRDGEVEQKVDLDAKQLSEGSIAYWPRTSDVNFRLELLAPGGAATESVRSIGGPVRPSQQAAPEEAAVPALAFPNLLPATAMRRSNATGTASRQRFRAFEFSEPPVREASLPEAPPIDPIVLPSLPKGMSFLRPIMTAGARGAPDDADPYLRVRVEPVEHVSRNFPLVGKRRRQVGYVPPAPVREPAVPVLSAQNRGRPVNIDVKVYVNPSGKVEYSEVLSKVRADDRDLAAAAMFSARRYEFTPAHAGSDAVPGEVILHYQFGGAGHTARDGEVAVR